jgi:hypothetical protein
MNEPAVVKSCVHGLASWETAGIQAADASGWGASRSQPQLK